MTSSPALTKIINVMGSDRGRQFYADKLAKLGLDDLRDPNDTARFGAELIKDGGVLASVGRSLKIQAILHGAQVSE